MKIQDCEKYADFALGIYRCTNWKEIQSFRHISILTDKRGNVLSFGINGYKSHPLSKKFRYRTETVHSELDAFLKIRHFDIKFNLINFRINNQELFRMSKPCNCCLNFLESTERLLDIFYTNENGFIKL